MGRERERIIFQEIVQAIRVTIIPFCKGNFLKNNYYCATNFLCKIKNDSLKRTHENITGKPEARA